MEREDEELDPIKLVYNERRAAKMDQEEEIAILRACGYIVPEDDIMLKEYAVQTQDFLEELKENEKNKIQENAKRIADRRKNLKQVGIKAKQIEELELKTPLELLSSHSRHKLDLYKNLKDCTQEAKQELLEAIEIGFNIQNDSIDNIEAMILKEKKY